MAKKQQKPASVSLWKLAVLLKQFDKVHGEYPESVYQGKAVGFFILHALGVSYKDTKKRLGRAIDWDSRYALVYEDKYRESAPGKLNLR